MLDNANSHQFFTVVSPVHHKRVGQTFNDWALGLPESLRLVPTSCVGHVNWMLGSSGGDVILHRKIRNLHIKTINVISPILYYLL
ncbi:hypothetical protein Hanom_Chr13g01230481 [Helianthus anomalus]